MKISLLSVWTKDGFGGLNAVLEGDTCPAGFGVFDFERASKLFGQLSGNV